MGSAPRYRSTMTQTHETTDLHRLRVEVDLGRSSDLRLVTAAVRDFGAVAAFAEDLAAVRGHRAETPVVVVVESQELRDIRGKLPEQGDWYELESPLLPGAWTAKTGRPVFLPPTLLIQQQAGHEPIRVERLRYSNPIEWVLVGGIAGSLYLLNLVVSSLQNASQAYHAHQRDQIGTEEYRDLATQRTRMRRHVTDAVISGDRELDPQLVDRLLTDTVADAAVALAQRPLEVEALE